MIIILITLTLAANAN